MGLHRDYHECMADFLKEEWSYYLPNKWVPHCAIALEVSKQKVAEIIKEILKDFDQFQFSIETLGIVEFRPVRELKTFSLNKKPPKAVKGLSLRQFTPP